MCNDALSFLLSFSESSSSSIFIIRVLGICFVFLLYLVSPSEIQLGNGWNINCNLKRIIIGINFFSSLYILQHWLISCVPAIFCSSPSVLCFCSQTSKSWWFCASRDEMPLGFWVCVCCLGQRKGSFFHKWWLLGDTGGVEVSSAFVHLFCFQRTLHFCGLFFPCTIKHPRDMSSTSPSSLQKWCLPRPPFSVPLISLVPMYQTCSHYFHAQGGTLFLEVMFMGCVARTRCGHWSLFSGQGSATFPCLFPSLCMIGISSTAHLLVLL